MLKKITLILVATVLPLLAMAQTVKLGYINSQEVMTMMPDMKNYEDEMLKFKETSNKYLENMAMEIQDKVAKFDQEKDSLPDAIRRATEEELQMLYQRYQLTQQNFTADLEKKHYELLQPLQEKLRTAIETVSKKQGLTMVYDMVSGAILYKSDAAIDITPAVKKELGIL